MHKSARRPYDVANSDMLIRSCDLRQYTSQWSLQTATHAQGINWNMQGKRRVPVSRVGVMQRVMHWVL